MSKDPTAPMLSCAERMKHWAAFCPPYTGHGTPRDLQVIQRCSALYRGRPTSSRLIFTHDAGMHACGWWKNPDYERCKHLSLSFIDTDTREPAPHDHDLAATWCTAFFGPMVNLIWAEPPFSPEGHARDVWHYRVFMHEDWRTPLLPRGEVYTREFTEAGWKSWSDLHGPKQESAHT